jgi:hypothetical protein
VGIARVLAGLRGAIGDRLRQLGVPEPEDTAAVLAGAIDGLLLHRAVGPEAAPATVAGVLRRLV